MGQPETACPVWALDAAGGDLTPALQKVIQPRIEQLARSLGAYCPSDFSYSNLYLFRKAHAYRLMSGDWPGIAGRTYDGQRHLFPLFHVREAPRPVIHALLAEHGCLFPLPAHGLHGLDDDPGYRITASRDDADYLYPASNFLDYSGRKLQKKRNLMKQFLRARQVRGEPLTAGNAWAAQAVLAAWMQDKGKAQGEADQRPCTEAIAQAEAFGMEGFVYFSDDVPAGFVLAQPLQGRTWAVRFAKGSDAHKGVYQFMFHDLAKRLADRADWLNFEQDMGFAGFRQAKMSYQPRWLLPKFRLTAS